MTLRRAAVALTALLSLASVTGPVGSAQAVEPSPAPVPVFSLREWQPYLSPDGDGRVDAAELRFTLRKRAQVRIRISDDAGVVRRTDLGRLGPGAHRWRWGGRDGDGAVVGDGWYSVSVRVVRGTVREPHDLGAFVDRVPDAGRVLTTRPTVYPQASLVSDHLLFSYLREGWTAHESEYAGDGPYELPSPMQVRLVIRSATGQVVWRDTASGVWTFTFDWYARDTGGTPLAAGAYTATVKVTDAAGNRSSFPTAVQVSDLQLRPEVWTSTVPAASAERYSPQYPPSCNGCGEYCRPVASARFPGGLSFPVCTFDVGYDAGTAGHFAASVPFASAPVDRFRVSATGGPTSPGGTDVGWLGGAQTPLGDGTTTTGWTSVVLTHPPYLDAQQPSATWTFGTNAPSSYDVATFTVEYQHYVPVP